MDELIQSEERRKAVVKFFANHVAAKYEQGKSTPTNLLGLLGRFSSSENYQWLKRTYPDHRTINFFLDNNDTFEYDDEKDLIKLKENYQGSTEHEDVKNVLSQLTLRVAEESDGPETLPSSPASSISSTSGLDLVRESAEERFLISANMSLEDMRTKYAAKIIEAINLKHEVASYKRRQREFTALKTSHRDLIVKHNALVKNSREIKRRLSAAKSKNFQLELKAGNSDGCEYFAQLVSKLSTDNDFIAILDEEIFDDVLNYFSSIFAQAIGFGDTPSTVNAKVMEYIAVILTNITYHKEGRERCCQWPNVTGLLDSMRFILQGTETKLSANGRLYLLMAIYNISVSDEGFALLSKQTGWAAILCLTLRNEDYCNRIKALCVKVLASFCLSSERRILQEVSGNLSTEYLRSLSRMPEMEEDVNHLSDLLYG